MATRTAARPGSRDLPPTRELPTAPEVDEAPPARVANGSDAGGGGTVPTARARQSAPSRRAQGGGTTRVVVPGTGITAEDGSGLLLGVFLWVLTLAYLNPSGKGPGGLTGVKNLLKAKFLNKAPDGSWLP